MVTASLISRLSRAVDLIEQRSQQNRPLKVVNVRCGYHEDRDAACDRHFAAHPEDRDANIVIFKFHDEEMAEESQGNEPKLVEHVVDQPAFAASAARGSPAGRGPGRAGRGHAHSAPQARMGRRGRRCRDGAGGGDQPGRQGHL